jgi:hypothetical protein
MTIMKQFQDEDGAETSVKAPDTLWRNDTTETARFRIQYEGSGKALHSALWYSVTIKPGETQALPAELDQGIRTVRRGQIVGGICPWLTRVDETDAPDLHPALDWKAVVEQQELEDLAAKIKRERDLVEAIPVQKQLRETGSDAVSMAAKPKNKGGRPRKSAATVPSKA